MYVFFFRKHWLFTMALSFLLFLLFLSFAWGQEKESRAAIKAMSWAVVGKTILVDPGHGGEDPGKVSPGGVLEKDINLAVAKKVALLLSQGGANVYLTREKDQALSNKQETIRARKRADLQARVELMSGKDLYVAIHCNAFPASRWFGAQTFYAPDVPGSKELAVCIMEELTSFPGKTTRKAQADATSYIFKRGKIPMVNVELGFLSNPREEILLQDEAYQDKLAWSIYAGIVRYLIEHNMEG